MAIVPVVLHHSISGDATGLLSKGPLGVDLFFALSGFLITTLLLRERDHEGHVDALAFYRRRALRIFPLYYLVLGVYVLRALLLLPEGPQRAHFFASLPFFATYTTNWFVDFAAPHPIIFAFSWSLAAEEQFYLLFPWLYRARAGPWLGALALVVLDRSAELGLLAAWGASPLAVRIASSVQTPICFGVLLACLLHGRRSFDLVYAVLGARFGALAPFAALLATLLLPGVPLWATQLVLVACVGAVVLREDHVLAPLLHQRYVARIGSVSYGVYMLHVSVVTGVKRVLPEASRSLPLVFGLSLFLSVIVAAVSYQLFESRFLRLRRHTGPSHG
jgi:peptidoglycan/LPS O-acetylase OafA/YrhL